MFKQSTIKNSVALAACVLSVAAVMSEAQATAMLPNVRVEETSVSGLRSDVWRVCPDVEQDLRRALAWPVAHFNRRGKAEITMKIHKANNVEVVSISGPAVYQRYLQRAVNGLVCHSDKPGAQLFAFGVSFELSAPDVKK